MPHCLKHGSLVIPPYSPGLFELCISGVSTPRSLTRSVDPSESLTSTVSPSITLVTVAEIKDGSFSDSFSFPSIFEVLAGVLKEEGSNVFEVVGVFSV